jgi:hypothetical protein
LGLRIVAAITEISPHFAAVATIGYVFNSIVSQVVEKIGQVNKMNQYKISLIKLPVQVATHAAVVVALATLGIIGPVGIGVMGVIASLKFIENCEIIVVQYKHRVYA